MSQKYTGGFITKNPTAPTSSAAPGIWTLDQALQYTKAGTWPIQPLPKYIEDVFSTWLYTGNGSSQTITNGIDLSGEGGLVWIKNRGAVANHLAFWYDGSAYPWLSTNTTAAAASLGSGNKFNADGFSLNASSSLINASSNTYASWTFRKAEKFFDVVTYTGNGAGTQTINHSLGSTPGFIVVKRLNATSDWWVYHRSLSFGDSLRLNLTNAVAAVYEFGTVNSTSFEVVANALCASGGTYVAYIFAHNAGGFGLTGTNNVISCGSFTSSGSGTATITLGYEPQWFLFKSSSAAGDWQIIDNMRGWSMGSQQILKPNSSAAEELNIRGPITPTGINITDAGAVSTTFIYIAIRRGPMETPTSGTSVFTPVVRTGTNGTTSYSSLSFSPDLVIGKARQNTYSPAPTWTAKLSGTNSQLGSSSTNAETTASDAITGWLNTGYNLGADNSLGNYNLSTTSNDYVTWNFGRAPGFFDVVCYTGTGSARTVSHNLGVAPELIIVKSRSTSATQWQTYSATLGVNYFLRLNQNVAASNFNNAVQFWNGTAPTSSVFSLGTDGDVNGSSRTYVAYLFASLSGVSKVGSYTGTGSSGLQINCGFTNGARFILIKRTDSNGDWFVFDTARGIVAGNDARLAFNSTDTETSVDWIDPYSPGFEIASTLDVINTNGGTYIFLAIA